MGGDYLIRREEDGKIKAFIHVYKTGDMRGITSIMFRDYLNSKGITATIRRELGKDIDAACGQLRRKRGEVN